MFRRRRTVRRKALQKVQPAFKQLSSLLRSVSSDVRLTTWGMCRTVRNIKHSWETTAQLAETLSSERHFQHLEFQRRLKNRPVKRPPSLVSEALLSSLVLLPKEPPQLVTEKEFRNPELLRQLSLRKRSFGKRSTCYKPRSFDQCYSRNKDRLRGFQ